MTDAISDVQRLVRLGYPEDVCKASLKDSKGDYQLALRMVQQKSNANNTNVIDNSWTNEQQDDWIRNVPTNSMSLDAKTRALGKSPIYVRIPSCARNYGENDKVTVMYKVAVTLKDSRRWELEKNFDDFFRLYNFLPYGTCAKFKAGFPKTATVVNMMGSIFTLSDVQIEERRSRLESWLLEICMTEQCMADNTILNLVYSFLQADAHGGRVTVSSSAARPGAHNAAGAGGGALSASSGSGPAPGESVPVPPVMNLPGLTTPSQAASNLQYKYSVVVPVTTVTTIPVPINKLGGQLPFKVNFSMPINRLGVGGDRDRDLASSTESLADLLGVVQVLAHAEAEAQAVVGTDIDVMGDSSNKQMEKDYSRDRVVVQGRRLQGSVSGFAGILAECGQVIAALAEAAGQVSGSPVCARTVGTGAAARSTTLTPPLVVAELMTTDSCAASLSAADITAFSRQVLASAGRTESAFRSHAALSHILDLFPNPNSTDPDAEMPLPYIVVPESELAKPIEINFQLKKKPPSASASASVDWCIVCDVQAATVYKVCDPESMEAVFQLKVTYYHQIFKFPSRAASASGSHISSPGPKDKTSTWLLLEKDTTTTRRDWQDM